MPALHGAAPGAPARQEEHELADLVPIDSVAPDAVEALLDRAFGPDRHRRTAYAVRGAVSAIPALSFAALEGRVLVGSIQCWPVQLAAASIYPLVMVGPVAVEPGRQGDGIGRALVRASLDAAAETGLDGALMLIGDPDYYGRFFGFSAAATGEWDLPGPVERHRLLARGPAVPSVAGRLEARATAEAR